MSISDPFHAERWVEQLWILRDRIQDPADGWRHAPHLPWENADPESNPVKFEVANIDSRWSLSRSEAGFVGGILQQFTRSQKSAFGYTFAASAWKYLGRHRRACAMLRRALAADPHYVPAYVIRAILHIAEDDLPAGIRDLAEALAVNPNSVPALTAYAMFETNSDPVAANSHLDRVLRLAPNHADAHVVRGVLAEAEDDEEAALSHLNRVLDIDPPTLWPIRYGLISGQRCLNGKRQLTTGGHSSTWRQATGKPDSRSCRLIFFLNNTVKRKSR